MGKGKGGLQGYIFQIKKGRILVEANSPKNITINFKKTLKKLPPFIRILHNKNTNFLN
jgi:ribosomal protein L16/L10AE